MKRTTQNVSITISISKQARLRLQELKTLIRANDVEFSESTGGMLVDKLILSEQALESLKKAYHLERIPD